MKSKERGKGLKKMAPLRERRKRRKFSDPKVAQKGEIF